MQQSEPITASQVAALFDALPHDECDRDAEGFSFSAGLFSRVQVGLRRACKLFPWSVQAVNRFATSLLSDAVYTSFAIFSRVQTRAHRDTQNSFLPNYVIPLSSFEGGAIRVDGPAEPTFLDVSKGPVQFCARHYQHSTAPFTGRRLVLVLFSLQAASIASADVLASLQRLGFPLPSPAMLQAKDICRSQAVQLTPARLRQLPSRVQDVSEGSKPLPMQGPSSAGAPCLVECLSSSGQLAAAAMQSGWDAIPIGKRFSAVGTTPLVPLDLTDEPSLGHLLNFDSHVVADWWHGHLFLKSCARTSGKHHDQPLRSADHIFGNPNLPPAADHLVQQDNCLCRALVVVLARAFATGALVSLVGPARSHCWSLLASCVKQRGPSAFVDWFFALSDQELDTCMFGAPFLTSVRLKASAPAFKGLGRACDKTHKHRAWAPSRPSAGFCDADLPMQFCEMLCARASSFFNKGDVVRPASSRCKQLRAQVRSAAANQPHYYPSLIPEFRVKLPLSQVPKGADYKVLSRAPGSQAGDEDELDHNKRFRLKGPSAGGSSTGGASSTGVLAGVYHTMEEHLHKACQLSCPADTSSRLPDAVRRNIFAVLTEGPLAISKKRMLALQALNAQLAELSSAEAELRKNMHPDVEAVTRGKAIALFGRLLEETGFPDMSVVDLLRDGVPLVGQENASALFDKRPKPQDIDPEQLKAQATLRRQVLQQMKGLASGEDYASLKSETEAEVAAGFMSGPFHSEQEVSAELGTDDWSLSPRFLLRQGEDSKVRIIDDFKMSAVNRAFGSTSFLELQDTDYAVGLLRFISRILQDKKRVKVPLTDGTVLEGDWSPEMLARPDLLGKTLDLSKAYRQVGIHPDTRDRAVLGFPGPSGAWEFYIAKSLPFGAAASVYGFNKIALAILHIMIVKFHAIATDFYDDYTVYEFRPAASLMDKILMRLLEILGWTFAKSGKKFVPFGASVVSLGVSLDLSEIWDGIVSVENKPGRLDKIAELLKAVAAGKEISRSEVASLHGLINFAGGLIMGFELKPTSRMLSRALSGPFKGNSVELRQACSLALDVIAQCRPKKCPASVKPPIVLYTDGAYEKGIATWGAVLIDPCTSARWVFGGTVSDALVGYWRQEAGQQVISQVEAFALAIVLFGIRGVVKGRSMLAFIDNEACRFGFIKRYSPSLCLLRLISMVALLEGSLETLLWFERVPSKSNPADLPSRGEAALACQRFQAEDKGDIALTQTMTDFLCSINMSLHWLVQS